MSKQTYELNRRDLIRLGVVTGSAALLLCACSGPFFEEVSQQIQNRPTRRNIAFLDPSDPYVLQYATVVQEMKNRSQANPNDPTGWAAFVDLHREWCPHGNWLFLPWHREVLLRFELIAQDILEDKSFGIPYWNWTEQRSIPPAFRTGVLHHPDRAFVDDGQKLPMLAGSAGAVDIAFAQHSFEPFASFRTPKPAGTPGPADQQRLETKGLLEALSHDFVHGSVGGDMGRVAFSPQDPVFYTHHAMLDYLWLEWNADGNKNTGHPDWADWSFKANPFPNPDGTLVNSSTVTPAWTTLYPFLLYKYEPSTVGSRHP